MRLQALTAEATAPGAPAGVVAGARQFARSVVTGLGLASLLMLLGPVVSYRADVATMREELLLRVSREARLHAQALGLYLELVESSLERLAQRPELGLLERGAEPGQAVSDAMDHAAASFGIGLAVLDRDGLPVWSAPPGLLASGQEQRDQRWFQSLLARGGSVFDATSQGPSRFVIGVPILRDNRLTGVLAGFLDLSAGTLPGWQQPMSTDDLLVTNAAGTLFLPEKPPSWAPGTDLAALEAQLAGAPEGMQLTLDGRDRLAAATPVGSTGLRLVLVADEDRVIAPARRRMLWQLGVIGFLQLATITLFSVFFRRIYRTFLQVESRAAERDRLAALGTAASLIAHEVKNALNGLKAATALLDADGGDLVARTIRGQTDRLAHLATSLLHFGKPAQPRAVAARLDELAREAVDGLRVLPEFDEVRLDVHLTDPVPVVCDPVLVVTALDNLVRNAIEAGVVAKDLGRVEHPVVTVTAGRHDGSAWIMVEDNAGGPASEVEARLFEPFVTGKSKGIGLGLAMARRALEQQGGVLAYERGAAGSRFIARLPAGSLA
jgi:signal transduction histidine kinase